jgi:hypothetical protein
MYLLDGNLVYNVSDDECTTTLIGNETKTEEIKDEITGEVIGTNNYKFNLETGEYEVIQAV